MVKTKRRRILFAIATIAMASAGTGLTLVNNIDIDAFRDDVMNGILITFIALCLAACFSAMESAYLWASKEIEDASKLWRKAVLVVTCIVLIFGMGFAFFEELSITLAKVGNRSLTNNASKIVKSVDVQNQRSAARAALKTISDGKININAMPFVIGYVIAGLSLIAIGAVAEKKRERVRGRGNLLINDPALAARVQQTYGIDPTTARAYVDKNGKGVAVWNNKSRQIGYLSNYDSK